MKNAFLLLLAAFTLSACAARLTVRNDRKTSVSGVDVVIGAASYKIEALESGASDVRKVKVPAETSIGVNFKSAEGGLYYTSSKEKLKKGDSRKLLLIINDKGLLETEEDKK